MKTYFSMILIACCLMGISCASSSTVATTPAGTVGSNTPMSRGMKFLANGETGKAVDEFAAACTAEPSSAKARNYLGMAYFMRNEFAKAAEEFKKAIELNGSYASAYNNLGGTDIYFQKYDEARVLYSKALALDPKNVSAHFGLANLLFMQGQEEEGLKNLMKAVELDPSYLERNEALISSLSFKITGETMFDYARAFASAGHIDQAVSFLSKAQKLGFKDWGRILSDKEFEAVRQDKRILSFAKS
jgi:tetratricopeptide (TPR) repeat protein